MSTHRIAILAIAAASVVSPAAFAQSQSQGQSKPPEAKQEPKPEAKVEAKATAATLAGRWNVTVNTGSSQLQSTLDLKADAKDAKKITGTITSTEGGTTPLEGTVVDGKLTFAFTFEAQGNSMVLTFTGTQQKDGSLAGTFNFGQTEMSWTGVKEKK